MLASLSYHYHRQDLDLMQKGRRMAAFLLFKAFQVIEKPGTISPRVPGSGQP
jgi:hypothetical protein